MLPPLFISVRSLFISVRSLIAIVSSTAFDLVFFLRTLSRSRTALVAENLFLASSFAEHQIKPRRLTDSARLCTRRLVSSFRLEIGSSNQPPGRLASKGLPIVLEVEVATGETAVTAEASPADRPHGPGESDLREERIADELWLKLGIRVSPRTVRAYWPDMPATPKGVRSQSWNTFVRTHARAVLACDFMVAVTVRFRILIYILVMEVGSRRISTAM